MVTNREIGIDALRGLAIIGMVLSGTISQNPELPGWLFHAQVGPADFKFHPEVPGITWVDLVFPFFLFAMGLSFPFSLNRYRSMGTPKRQLAIKVGFRTFKLFLFAILLGHLSPFGLLSKDGILSWLFGLLAFFGFFLAYSKISFLNLKERNINLLGFLILFTLLVARTYVFEIPFSIHENDIIILVLANMALFGALIWYLTPGNWYARLLVIAIYLAFRITSDIPESWTHSLWGLTPLKTLGSLLPGVSGYLQNIGVYTDRTVFYSSNFLKYLFVVIPGTIAGDLLYKINTNKRSEREFGYSQRSGLQITIYLSFIICNLIGLYNRWLVFTVLSNVVLICAILYLTHSGNIKIDKEYKSIIKWSVAWLLVGLVLEPFEGGIKKDPATLSYLFLTPGLAGFTLLLFKLLNKRKWWQQGFNFIAVIGQNPMVGYVAVGFLIVPLLALLGINEWIDNLHLSFKWLGVLRGIFLTALMILITAYTVRRKWFWKT